MKAKGIVIFLVLMILISFVPSDISNAEEQDQKYIASFTKGYEYLEFQQYEKIAYIRGMMDSIFALLQAYVPEKYQKHKEAMEGMTLAQLAKILDKYLEENPEKLHYAVGSTFLNALSEIVFKE